MAEEKWLAESIRQAEMSLQRLRNRIDKDCREREEIEQLAALDEDERQPILEEAQALLAKYLPAVNELADDLADYAKAPVNKPTRMTPELFIHPYNVAPRLRWRVKSGDDILDYAYYYYWRIHFYETEVRLCLTISDQEEPLYVLVKDLTPNSLYRLAVNNLEDVKRRLKRNVKRHYYLNEQFGEVD